jgi:NAD(P)-dependent dehydrogenase (short-subunit alcohol dehydrogenase family)
MSEMEHMGKAAFVTGAGSKRGMGHAIALRLAGQGANIIVVDKYAAPKSFFPGDEGWRGLHEEVEEIKALGREALALTADINNSKEANEGVEKALKKFGRIDLFVHCAAIRGPVDVPVVDLSEEDWRRVVDVNLNGVFIISKPIAQHMIKRGGGGKMVHIASVASKMGVGGSAAYAASKWGALGFTQSLALELAPYKINVNAVCPGFINTNLRDEWVKEQARIQGISTETMREKYFTEMTKHVPLGRHGTAEDIADVVMFLLSKQADYMTGQAINVSGGHYMH